MIEIAPTQRRKGRHKLDELVAGITPDNVMKRLIGGPVGNEAWYSVRRLVTSSVYGGANAYGKTAVTAGYTAEGVSVKIRRKRRNEWC